ncbi:hypothetical protein [Helicobacter pylori]|jgi:hypothetical protein|uniref:Uncharacterized protein n=2 Tax=Helicobacter pylori TaxID=210 RepID=O25461_HELPY|nr:hypothetical protein [Helicobacter pylori]AAD07815.1 predicted coding region HP0766 [Helicobacter pylori 26695]AFV41978.1 hypothetical protein C694_03935 [Helicobacter pylori 26695]AFV43571.1 hypothetical protein C695_03940 [Helicobacter pylori Rif1]AFV45165.1 hypothetical protein C730_03945 [Helicobacter pylori Rif2]AJF09029.1 hypothetical protein SE87_03905 [Helicobacter pylori 26695-1]
MLENMQDISLQSSHEVGVDITESKMLTKFASSLLMNLYEYIGNGKDPKEASDHAMRDAKDVVLSCGRVAFLKDIVSNSPNETIQSFDGDLEVAMHLEKIGIECYKIFIDYGSQKIDDNELSCRLLHTGTKILGTKAMAVVGQTFIPIPGVGAIIGNFVGALLSKTLCENLRDVLKEAKLARQRRIEIEKECRESIRLLEIYRNQFKEVFERYFHGNVKFFNENFNNLERALYAGDADLAIGVNNEIQERLGQKPLFNNTQEFLELMNNGGKIEI